MHTPYDPRPETPQVAHPAASSRYTPPTPPQAEVEAVESISVDWDGLQVTAPASVEDWDPDAVEAFESGKVIGALRGLLGSDTYDALRDAWSRRHGRRPVMRDLTRLFEALAQAYGFTDLGE